MPVGLSDSSACGSDLPLAVTSAVSWTVPGPTSASSNSGNGTLKYVFCYAQVEVFIPNGVNELQSDSGDLRMYLTELERIILPNSQKWTFQYDSSDGPNPSYGDLTKITLPTGGSISYTYQSAPRLGGTGRGVLTRIVDAADGSGPRTWTYTGGYTADGAGPFTTTVTAPPVIPGQPGDVTIHTFMSSGNPIETSVTQYQGSASNGRGLQTVTKTYDPVYSSTGGGDVFTQGFFPKTVTTTLDGVVTSQKVYQYCCNFSVLEGTETYGLVSDVKTYDFGSGSPGGLLKEESTQYLFQMNSDYGNDNMLNYVASKTVTGGGTTALTTYGYDESAYIATASSSVPNFGIANTAHPGYATTETQSVSGSSSIVSHTKFYTTGEKYQDIDPRNVTSATYTYSPAYGFALPSQVTNALGQTTAFTYDTNTGQKISSTDPNNQTTSWSYDASGRLSGVSYADGGRVSYCYNDLAGMCSAGTGAVNSVIVTKVENTSKNLQIEADVDSLGRKVRTIANEGNGSFLYTDTHYDALGRVQSISNPYRSTADVTYGITQYVYDALARKVEEISPDSSSSWWCYNGDQTSSQPNCFTNVASANSSSWVDMSDQEGKHWQHASDAAGRLTGVMEPDPSTGSLSLSTRYSYNGLDDLVSIVQGGNGTETSRTRSFQYDSLARLTNSSNPETGTISYGYINNAGALCAGDVSLPCSKTDARGVVTNYAYDSVNHLLSKQYSDGTTLSSCFVYGSANTTIPNGIGRLVQEWTQIGTCGSSPPASDKSVQRFILSYDAMGRVLTESRCLLGNCKTSTNSFSLTTGYDLAGNLTNYDNGLGNLTIFNSYDGAGRLWQVNSSANDPTHPFPLYTISNFAAFGAAINSAVGSGISVTQGYDSRLRVTGLSAVKQ
jgi:YD repeat-containing protein